MKGEFSVFVEEVYQGSMRGRFQAVLCVDRRGLMTGAGNSEAAALRDLVASAETLKARALSQAILADEARAFLVETLKIEDLTDG